MPIRVALGERSYPIVVSDSFRRLPASLGSFTDTREGWVISHRSLLRRYGSDFIRPLERAGWTVRTLTIPESEASKSFKTVQDLIRSLARRPTMRVPILVAFGGGVVGDVTGFVAATYRRGVPYVQVPTTLLAQVDSAIGGKVGIDLPHAKNFVGTFYQPSLVWNNVSLLRTLSMRQRRSGLAEIIKYGVIADPVLFRLLERRVEDSLALSPRLVLQLLARSCRIKARVVAQDERDTKGIRAMLNFGHTMGHALEAATRYRRWTHGEAIAVGMCVASELAVALGWCGEADYLRIVRLIRAMGLPTRAPGVSRRTIWQALRYDKKSLRGRPRWVLPTRIGRVIVTERVPMKLLERVVVRALDSRTPS